MLITRPNTQSLIAHLTIRLTSLHTSEDPASDVTKAEAIFIGGGNSFQLLHSLYQHSLIDVIRK